MTDIQTKPPSKDDAAAHAQQQARAKALEDEQKQRLAVQVEPSKAVQHAQAAGHAASQPDKIGAAHNEAARNLDRGREWQQLAQTQPAHAQPPHVGAKPAVEQSQKIADLQRLKNPAIKG